jgi:DMSO/TMAO reductase YedYZ molybdopterin-dependent catalytic subunit
MQILKQHKRTVLIAILLVAILVMSLFIVFLSTLTSPPQNSNPGPYLGEVTHYQNQSLTSISQLNQALISHPDVSIRGVQNINQTTYRLAITGLVNNTLHYSYDEVVNSFQSHQEVATIICVEGWSSTNLWQGVLVNDLVQQAKISPNATTLIFNASDGYTTAIPIDSAAQNNYMIAYKINNVTLTPLVGWPFVLIAQNQYGYKWIRWITEIKVSNDSSYLGFWESRGYPNNATIR